MNKKYEILTPSGFKKFDNIQRVKKHEYLEIILENNLKMKCSLDHRFVVNNKEIYAHTLTIHDYLDTKNNLVKIKSIKQIDQDINLYDMINVDFGNIFYANDIVNHNCDCDFMSSGHTVVAGEILQFYKDTYIKEPVERQGVDGSFWIWSRPNYERSYMVVADVARGDGADYSAFHVFDIETLQQCAEYKGKLGTKEYGHFLVNVATMYGEALLVIENANIGWAVLQVAIDREYRNLYYSHKTMDYRIQDVDTYVSKGYDLKDKRDMVPGFTTSSATRPLIVSKMELYMRERAVEIYSQRLWDELSVFIWLGNGRPEAQYGYNDDLVLAFAIAMWIRDTAIRLEVQGMQMTKNALGQMANTISLGGIYTNATKQHESWTYNYGQGNMDLTEWI